MLVDICGKRVVRVGVYKFAFFKGGDIVSRKKFQGGGYHNSRRRKSQILTTPPLINTERSLNHHKNLNTRWPPAINPFEPAILIYTQALQRLLYSQILRATIPHPLSTCATSMLIFIRLPAPNFTILFLNKRKHSCLYFA